MIGIILAAGKGTRLRPLTYAIPKPLLPVGGRPVLDYAIENLSACKEITKIYVAVSHAKEIIENYVKNMDYGIEVETVTTSGLETGGDLRAVIDEKKIQGQVFVAYGDIVSKINAVEMFVFHKKHKKSATVALFEVPDEDVNRFGIADMDGDLVKKFVEKPKKEESPSNLANAGYYILEKSAQDQLPSERKKVEEVLFPRLALEGQLAGYVCKPDYWLDIGTIEAYRKANRLVEGILPPKNSGDIQ